MGLELFGPGLFLIRVRVESLAQDIVLSGCRPPVALLHAKLLRNTAGRILPTTHACICCASGASECYPRAGTYSSTSFERLLATNVTRLSGTNPCAGLSFIVLLYCGHFDFTPLIQSRALYRTASGNPLMSRGDGLCAGFSCHGRTMAPSKRKFP